MSASASESSGRIFISYRRQDSAYPAGWLYDRLADRFGPDQVFKDVDSIELGDDFVETITNAVGSCDILLALIGQEWLDITSSDGSRRLDDPDDFVRLEIEAALERKVLLIPILVEGATMPRGDQLPPSIAPMVRRQALELSPTRFRADTERLLDVMERTLADIQDDHEPSEAEAPVEAEAQVEAQVEAEAPPPPLESAAQLVEDEAEPERDRPLPWRLVLAGVAAVAVIAAVIVGIVNLVGDDPKKEPDSIDFSSPPAAATAPPKLGGSRCSRRAGTQRRRRRVRLEHAPGFRARSQHRRSGRDRRALDEGRYCRPRARRDHHSGSGLQGRQPHCRRTRSSRSSVTAASHRPRRPTASSTPSPRSTRRCRRSRRHPVP